MSETAAHQQAQPPETGAQATAPEPGDRSTHFNFSHRVFQLDGARFTLAGRRKEPVFHVSMGEVKGVVPLGSLRREFNIPDDSADARLLEVVGESLRYVKEIRPGDSIPREILDGTASWSVDDTHRTRARNRLTVALAAPPDEEHKAVSDPERLAKLVGEPETRKRADQAIEKIGEKLDGGRAAVEKRIDGLVRELAYIEGLRDRYGCVMSIVQKVGHIANLYKQDNAILEEIVRVQTIIRQPAREFADLFQDVDAKVAAAADAIGAPDETVQHIRRVRDEIHFRLMDWDEMIEEWEKQRAERSDEIEGLIRRTYRFLAYRYPQTQTWDPIRR